MVITLSIILYLLIGMLCCFIITPLIKGSRISIYDWNDSIFTGMFASWCIAWPVFVPMIIIFTAVYILGMFLGLFGKLLWSVSDVCKQGT